MLKAYLADLRHDFGGVPSTDCMPLSVGYMKAVMDRDLPPDKVDVRIFAFPAELINEMKNAPPDIVMVSNYVWNEGLSRFILRKARQINPGVLTIMGGPNIPVESDRQIAFVEERPEIDLYVLGEGDFLAAEIVRFRLSAGPGAPDFDKSDLSSVVYRRPDGSVVARKADSRIGARDINEIPSPWLTGVMDHFFDGRLAPIIETNRGCPFRCSFCVQGTDYYTKVTRFGEDRLEAELDYIAARNHERSPHMGTLRIADANYGMFERDTVISRFIGRAQEKYGWPTFIDATTGKNRAENIIRSMEQVNGALVLYQAVQSLDEEVLRNVRRSNIKLEAYSQIQVHVRGRGLRSSTDLILGLPGESLNTHLGALHRMIDLGTDQAHCFQAMMLKGSDMEALETRRKFSFGTRYRVLPKNFGEYDGEKVFDIEEIVVETESLPFDDYIQCRKHHLAFSVFWNDSWFSDVLEVVRHCGIKPSEWLTAMLEGMESDTGAVGRFLQDFVTETRGELFDTYESCRAFYAEPGNFEKLLCGEIGDNLMYKYRAIASFFLWKDICQFAMDTTAEMLRRNGVADKIVDFEEVWPDFHRFIEARHASGAEIRELVDPVRMDLAYDIPGWLASGNLEESSSFRLSKPKSFQFQLSEGGRSELEAALKVWSSRTIGLSKLVTRVKITAQIRDVHPV